MSDKYYPQLSNIASLDSLPEQLSFIEGGLQQILSNLHYRNYQVSQSSLPFKVASLGVEFTLIIPFTSKAFSDK